MSETALARRRDWLKPLLLSPSGLRGTGTIASVPLMLNSRRNRPRGRETLSIPMELKRFMASESMPLYIPKQCVFEKEMEVFSYSRNNFQRIPKRRVLRIFCMNGRRIFQFHPSTRRRRGQPGACRWVGRIPGSPKGKVGL